VLDAIVPDGATAALAALALSQLLLRHLHQVLAGGGAVRTKPGGQRVARERSGRGSVSHGVVCAPEDGADRCTRSGHCRACFHVVARAI